MENWNPDDHSLSEREDLLFTLVTGRSGTGKLPGQKSCPVRFDLSTKGGRSRMRIQESRVYWQTSGYDYPWIYSKGGFPVQEVLNAGFQPDLSWEGDGSCLSRRFMILREIAWF